MSVRPISSGMLTRVPPAPRLTATGPSDEPAQGDPFEQTMPNTVALLAAPAAKAMEEMIIPRRVIMWKLRPLSLPDI